MKKRATALAIAALLGMAVMTTPTSSEAYWGYPGGYYGYPGYGYGYPGYGGYGYPGGWGGYPYYGGYYPYYGSTWWNPFSWFW
ncbi:MAG: hypothetical protein HQL52_01820 [Magnetococcales bacterium]|nr:hypothetical protein [Magnetococcales bacterium]